MANRQVTEARNRVQDQTYYKWVQSRIALAQAKLDAAIYDVDRAEAMDRIKHFQRLTQIMEGRA